jgi:hypothetical protein
MATSGRPLNVINHTAQQIAYVTVRIVVPGSADPYETIENCAYSFDHPDIVQTEIVGVADS